MLSYNYTLTNVGYNSSYYYDNIFINMDCDPEQFEFFYSFPINNLSCEYINRSNNSGYKCNHKILKNDFPIMYKYIKNFLKIQLIKIYY